MDSELVDEITGPWPKQKIPDTDLLYMRVHKNHITNGVISFIAFRNHGNPSDSSKKAGMSTDWSEYSTAEECRQRAKVFNKDPNNYEVIQFIVGDIQDKERGISGQSVEHTPIYEPNATPPIFNRAHADVVGEKDEEVRLELRKRCRPATPFSL